MVVRFGGTAKSIIAFIFQVQDICIYLNTQPINYIFIINLNMNELNLCSNETLSVIKWNRESLQRVIASLITM